MAFKSKERLWSGTRRGHRGIHVGRTTARDLGDDGAVDGAHVLEDAAIEGADRLAIDEGAAFGFRGSGELLPFLAGTSGAKC